MSQSVTDVQEVAGSPTPADAYDEFQYHPITPLAPISLFLGICAVAGLLGIPGLAVGFVGFLVGLIALWQIGRSGGELGGRMLARTGTVLAALFLVSGSALHAYNYVTELPDGYQRVSFNWLSKQDLQVVDGSLKFTPEVEALEEQPIYIKGYMYPTRQREGISEFVLVKDTGQCCFGGNPKINDMIVVKFKDGMKVNHKEQTLVAVGGIFKASKAVRSGDLTAIYSLEGTHFR